MSNFGYKSSITMFSSFHNLLHDLIALPLENNQTLAVFLLSMEVTTYTFTLELRNLSGGRGFPLFQGPQAKKMRYSSELELPE